jgi:hypothetical protein
LYEFCTFSAGCTAAEAGGFIDAVTGAVGVAVAEDPTASGVSVFFGMAALFSNGAEIFNDINQLLLNRQLSFHRVSDGSDSEVTRSDASTHHYAFIIAKLFRTIIAVQTASAHSLPGRCRLPFGTRVWSL